MATNTNLKVTLTLTCGHTDSYVTRPFQGQPILPHPGDRYPCETCRNPKNTHSQRVDMVSVRPAGN